MVYSRLSDWQKAVNTLRISVAIVVAVVVVLLTITFLFSTLFNTFEALAKRRLNSILHKFEKIALNKNYSSTDESLSFDDRFEVARLEEMKDSFTVPLDTDKYDEYIEELNTFKLTKKYNVVDNNGDTFYDALNKDKVYKFLDKCSEIDSSIKIFISSIVILTVLVTFINIVSPKYFALKAESIPEEKVCNIMAMDRENEISGSRYSIHTEGYYYYYMDKATYMCKIRADQTDVVESNAQPALYRYKVENSFEIRYRLYVPEGTISNAGFNIF